MQELFTKLRALAKSEGIDLERTFQDAGGTRFGTISKRLFMSALCIAFQHYTFSEKELDDIVEEPDSPRGGGAAEARAFAAEAASPFEASARSDI